VASLRMAPILKAFIEGHLPICRSILNTIPMLKGAAAIASSEDHNWSNQKVSIWSFCVEKDSVPWNWGLMSEHVAPNEG
jgi:hypothetical protein